jgi:hypothetical protein
MCMMLKYLCRATWRAGSQERRPACVVTAQVAADGRMLGPVGGRIVAEVLIGLLQGDPMSQLRQNPDWTPVFGQGPMFTMSELLRFAGVA